jgi:hypothetical protein
MHTNEQSSGVYDPIAKEIWFPTVYTSGGVNQVGFACIRTDDITLTNKWCGGSAASAFVSAGIDGNIAGTVCSGGSSTRLYDCTGGIAKSGNRIFSWHTARGDLMCVDILEDLLELAQRCLLRRYAEKRTEDILRVPVLK